MVERTLVSGSITYFIVQIKYNKKPLHKICLNSKLKELPNINIFKRVYLL